MRKVDAVRSAIQAYALYLVALAASNVTGLLVVRAHFLLDPQVVAVAAGLPLAGAVVAWRLARPASMFLAKDASPDAAATTRDLVRAASVFSGLFLTVRSLPGIVLALATWFYGVQRVSSLMAPRYGLRPAEQALLFDVSTRAQIATTVFQLALGMFLIAAPSHVERFLSRLRRDSLENDFDGHD